MTKEDMIIDMIQKIDERNREDHQIMFKKIDEIKDSGRIGLNAKEWGIISGIITVVCTAAVTIAQIIGG